MSTVSRLNGTSLNFTSNGIDTNAIINSSASTLDFEGVAASDVVFTGISDITISDQSFLTGVNQVSLNDNTITGVEGNINTQGDIVLYNATRNNIVFNPVGASNPSFTNRGIGSKIVYWPNTTASTVDYAVGINTNIMWNSIPNTTGSFTWYGGTTEIFTVNGEGPVSIKSTNHDFTPSVSVGESIDVQAATFNDNITSASGTTSAVIVNRFASSTITATNSSVTTTNAATVYIEDAPIPGTNETFSNSYALWIPSGDVLIGGNLTVGGNINSSYAYTEINTATYNILELDQYIGVQYTVTDNCTLTLPLISTVGKKIYTITDVGGNGQKKPFTVNVSGSDNIVGDTSLLIKGDYASVSLYNDGVSEWFIY